MLKIQVLGKGMIPRGLGLAPKKEPFKADLTLIKTIIATPGLRVNYENPESGKLLSLTRENVDKIYQKYANYVEPVKAAPILTPATPVDAVGSELNTITNQTGITVDKSGVSPVEEVKPIETETVEPTVDLTAAFDKALAAVAEETTTEEVTEETENQTSDSNVVDTITKDDNTSYSNNKKNKYKNK